MAFEVSQATHGVAALFLLLLLLAQLRFWQRGTSSLVLLGATTITLLWSSLLALQSQLPLRLFYLIPFLEILKNLSWFTLLLSMLGLRKLVFPRFREEDDQRGLLLVTAISLGIPLLLAGYLGFSQFIDRSPLLFPSFNGRGLLTGFLVMAIVGLALLEQVIRNTRYHHVWHVKFLCVSLGVLFTYDVYLYSNALLFDQVNYALWQARGGVIALATPLIAISVLRTRRQPIQVNISRKLVFHTGVLVAAGLYLLLMALTGFYIRSFSGEWGVALQVIFWVVSLTLLLVLMYSGTLRSALKTYINRHLFSSKYDYRDEWMRISNTLSQESPDENPAERALHALADIVDSPGGALWLTVNDTHYDQFAQLAWDWFDGSGLTSRDYLIEHLRQSPQMVDLTDPESGLEMDRLPGWLRNARKAWLIVPLHLHEKLIGFIILKESRVDFELNWEDFELMKAASQQTASYLAQMVASDALSEARQFSAFNQVSAFVVHDIKTLNSQLSLMVRNAERHKHNPSFIEDMIKTTEHAVTKMNVLLKHFRNDVPRDAEGDIRAINLVSLIEAVVADHGQRRPAPEFHREASDLQVMCNPVELKSAIGHLVQNAQEATPETGSVTVTVDSVDGNARIRVQDTGVGMTQEFINTRLFKAFDSTKGLTGMGIGVYQCRATVRRLDGNLTVTSEPGQGSEFTITLPIYRDE